MGVSAPEHLSKHQSCVIWSQTLAHLKTQGRGKTVTYPTPISCSNTFTTVFNLVFFLWCHELFFQSISESKTHRSLVKNHWLVILTTETSFVKRGYKPEGNKQRKENLGKSTAWLFSAWNNFNLDPWQRLAGWCSCPFLINCSGYWVTQAVQDSFPGGFRQPSCCDLLGVRAWNNWELLRALQSSLKSWELTQAPGWGTGRVLGNAVVGGEACGSWNEEDFVCLRIPAEDLGWTWETRFSVCNGCKNAM